MNKYKVDAVPHLICGGFNVEDTENALIDLKFLGIDNILALRGDPIKTEQVFQASKGGHEFAIDLINQIVEMNKGKYLDDDHKNSPTEFCIGCAGYPEKHFEAMNLESDMANLKAKVDAGAEYITTQMFYDNDKYFAFVEKCREMGINVPIIPGLKPITSLTHKTFLPKFFHIDFPMELSKDLDKCKSNADVNELGVEWGINQAKDLIKRGAPVLHFYTMGKGAAVKRIAKEIF